MCSAIYEHLTTYSAQIFPNEAMEKASNIFQKLQRNLKLNFNMLSIMNSAEQRWPCEGLI